MSQFRILMSSSYFPPEYSGAALQAISLARELRDKGHYIEFVTQRWPGLAADDVIEGFPVTRLEPGRGSKHRELRLWWNLYRFLLARRGSFDILHSHGAYYKDAFVGPMARRFGLKSVVKASLANNDLQDLGRSLSGRIHRAMLRRVDACIAISHDLEREFEVGGISVQRIHYLPNGVDTERFRPAALDEKQALRGKLGLPPDKKILLYVGVFDERKNIGWLIQRWVESNGFGLAAMLVAIGPQSREDQNGAFKEEVLKLAKRHGAFLHVGDQTEDIVDYYRAADVFVMPSLCEGMPNAVLEAMACGLPCVAANVSGTRELVEEGQTGYLFAINDTGGLRASLERTLGEGQGALGRRGRALVERDYAMSRVAQHYEIVYREILNVDG